MPTKKAWPEQSLESYTMALSRLQQMQVLMTVEVVAQVDVVAIGGEITDEENNQNYRQRD